MLLNALFYTISAHPVGFANHIGRLEALDPRLAIQRPYKPLVLEQRVHSASIILVNFAQALDIEPSELVKIS
jgi:hypothetical protein